MAKNDVNNRQGKLGEIKVAEALILTGCAVNFLSFMDVGLDLLIQLPAGLEIPDASALSWQMSGRSAHVQVKTTRSTSARLPAISRETALAWQLGGQTGTPTAVVAVIVDESGSTEYRFFSPMLIKEFAERCKGKSFKIPVDRGEIVDTSDLFERVAYWVENSRYFLSDAVGFTWPAKKADVWESSLRMVSQLTLIYERAFSSASDSVQSQSFGELSEAFMGSFLRGADAEDDALYRTPGGRSEPLLYEVQQRAHDAINGAGSDKHGWSDWVEPLSAVSPHSDEYSAHLYLSEICAAYGRAAGSRLKLPS